FGSVLGLMAFFYFFARLTLFCAAWIDDGETSLPPEKIQVPLMLTPTVVKVAANSGQQIKIKIMPNK
ncbi:fimbria/pilus periplasmic chaperone, partial [Escherichia coli]|uniref:fimbria/pilus periplasmic chaperone n=1 Tax=Escherichia coli TaxID=562 RepID=UPI003D32D939